MYLERRNEAEWKKDIFKKILALVVLLIVNYMYNVINIKRDNLKIVETFIDKYIEFNKYFIIPYVIWYFYIGITIGVLFFKSNKEYYKLIITVIITALISYGIFIFYPTTIIRPILTEDDIFTKLVKMIYANDQPYNCFPSIHVSFSTIMAIYWCRVKNPIWSKILWIVMAIFICLSTVYIKQHYFVDIIGGLLVSIIVSAIVIKFTNKESISSFKNLKS